MSNARELAQIPSTPSGRRNLIINGAMNVAQRGTSATGITSGDYHTLDRIRTVGNMTTRSYSQDSNAPSGFANSLKVEITTADASPDAGAFLTVEQLIEGQNLQHLKKGTSDAKAITASFWVKSNVAGTYILEVDDIDNARKINKSYTINSANTWEYKTITFEGDTTGTLDDDNFGSMRIIWWLDAGSNFRSGTLGTSWQAGVTADRVVGNVSFGNTVGNTWQITGVQLEVGSTATEFEHRSYGEELALCQRYLQKIELNQYQSIMIMRGSNNGGGSSIVHMLPVAMRDNFTTAYTGDVTAAYWSNIGNTGYSTETVKFYISTRSSGRGYAWGISEASFVGNNELVATANYSSSVWLYLDAEL